MGLQLTSMQEKDNTFFWMAIDGKVVNTAIRNEALSSPKKIYVALTAILHDFLATIYGREEMSKMKDELQNVNNLEDIIKDIQGKK